jgi:hypothetical protein
MALKDWVRHEGDINSFPRPRDSYRGDDEFIMLVRNIQYQEVRNGSYNRFPNLYDVAFANKGRNYIPVTDNTRLIQDPPDVRNIRNNF